MSLKGPETVVKKEPLHTDDVNIDTEAERRNSGRVQLVIKNEPEPDWDIETYLATSRRRSQVVKVNNNVESSTSKEMSPTDHVKAKVKDEMHNESTQASWHLDDITKIKKEVNLADVMSQVDFPGVSQVDLQVNAHTYNTPLIQSKTQGTYTNSNIKEEKVTSTFNKVATPTCLAIDQMVKIESDSNVVNADAVSCIQLQLDSDESKANSERTRHTGRETNDSGAVQSGLCTENILKVERASPVAGLYKDHVVKEELVVGPEVLQRPNLLSSQAINGARSNTAYDSCFVRLENMHVDIEHRVCRIGCNTYKLGPCLQQHQDLYTQEITRPTLQKDQNKVMTNKRLIRYQVSNVQDKPFKCNVCHYASSERYRLEAHKKTHSDDKPFRCDLCSYASAFKTHLEIHARTHTKKKPFKCDKCSYSCVQKSDLLVHERVHAGLKPFKCDYCTYACRRKRDLLTHIRTHTGEKPYKCKLCDYGCIRKRDFIVHTSTHRILDGQEFNEIHKFFKCDKCNYACFRKSDLTEHERVHTGEKPFKCNYCGYACIRKRDLSIHIRTHACEKNCKCNHCGCSRTSKRDLTIQTNTYQSNIDGRDEKRHKCSHCDYSTDHKTHLKVHQRKHTGEKPYKCSRCTYATAQRRELLVHETLHHGEKPYKGV